ncbi:2'-5' RNA ligase family protein [Limibacter armeniacum]|uniref:2'-5' RNA ligase family protein n=1 Tax=Limibacter armeniacum TaxID=466084 RepID=UPI002FE4FFCC
MKLKEHYNKLYEESIQKIKNDQYQIDDLIDSNEDNRYGVTLLIRPDKNAQNKIQQFLDELRVVEPKQYFYPNTDIHVTVMSIISCYEGFDLSQIVIDDYIKVISKSIENCSPFDITFKGLTASPSCIMLQGFLEDEMLNNIRENLRKQFQNADLEQSIDKRYAIQTAHSTIFRLRDQLANKEELLSIIEKYRDFDFGTFTVDKLEFVYNDWYQRDDRVTKLHEFKLN